MVERRWPTGIEPRSGSIRIRIYHKGKEYTETIDGDAYNPAHVSAAVKRREYIKSRLKLGLPISEADNNATTEVFEKVAQDWLNAVEVENSTLIEYTSTLNAYWMPVFAARPVNEIQASEIREVLKARKVSPKTKRNALSPLRQVLELAVEKDYCESNVAMRVKLPKSKKTIMRKYTIAQRDKILNAAIILYGQHSKEHLYFSLFFGTGMRPSELRAMQWCDYDGETIHVHSAWVRGQLQGVKNHEERMVRVAPWLREILKNSPNRFAGGYLFPSSTGKPYYDSKELTDAWEKMLKRANVPTYRPYTCRHTRASELLTAGVEPAFAARQLGHKLDVFLKIYSQWLDGMRTAEQEALIDGLDGPKTKSTGQIPSKIKRKIN